MMMMMIGGEIKRENHSPLKAKLKGGHNVHYRFSLIKGEKSEKIKSSYPNQHQN
jgi:hypothetical protein